MGIKILGLKEHFQSLDPNSKNSRACFVVLDEGIEDARPASEYEMDEYGVAPENILAPYLVWVGYSNILGWKTGQN